MAVKKAELQADCEVFEQNRKEWYKSHPGEFVLIHKRQVEGFYPDYEGAFRAGLQRFGIQAQFLVKQVWAEEPVFVIY